MYNIYVIKTQGRAWQFMPVIPATQRDWRTMVPGWPWQKPETLSQILGISLASVRP
jgi:hypothetical protein